ncbi:MAG: ABC transporter permease [Phycisphaeraceae bacterium]|nr:ABC transporter permease [Phycisphaeraceae bacterium]
MNFLLETLRLGLSNLRLHKMRSLLTVLGIIFGVSAVIAMVAIGEGNKQRALAEIANLGARNIILRSVKPPESQKAGSTSNSQSWMIAYGLTRLDLSRLRQTVGQITQAIALKKVSARIERLNLQSTASVFGTEPTLLDVTRQHVSRGRFITDADNRNREPVVVLGAEIARRLFPLEDPLGQTVRVQGVALRVVGVMALTAGGASPPSVPAGASAGGPRGGGASALTNRDPQFDVYMPMGTAEAQFSDMTVNRSSGSTEAESVELSELILEADNQSYVPAVAERVRRVLAMDKQPRDDVEVVVPLELLLQAERTQRNFNYLLSSIASISLLVGGIGIMNIMLATVTERTREIGVRRALGATRKHVVAQFLVETTVLSGLGGLLGVALGVACVPGLRTMRYWFPQAMADLAEPQLTTWSILVSFLAAAAVGIVFGLYPAVKASRQDPIVALRHD